MAFSKLKSQARDAAKRVADSDQAQAARQLAADRGARLGPRLREIVEMKDQGRLTPEALLTGLVSAVRGDGEVDLSLRDVRAIGRRNERMAAAAGILGGGIGCLIADMYADAALYCRLDESFGLELSDRDITARLLVSWGSLPDLPLALAVMDPADPATIAGEARRRFGEEVTAATKKDSVRTLWRLRSGVAQIPIFDPSTFKDLLFSGRAVQQRLDGAAAQLGLPADAVGKAGFLRRHRPGPVT